MSKHSAGIDEFYATSPATAQWLLEELASRHTLEGTALEPCVGGFVFPNACSQLNWTTNDLNSWVLGKHPDTLQDFLEGTFEKHDFVITNPPFGPNNKLAFAFLEKSAQLADIVAMILPSSMGTFNARLHKIMPPDFKLVFSAPCPDQWFELPDGSKRPVRTHGVIWERIPGYKRPAPKKEPIDSRTDILEFCDDGPFAIRIYGDGIGDLNPYSENHGGTWARLKFQRNKQCIGLKLLMAYPWRWHFGSSGKGRAPWDGSPGVVPAISTSRLTHFVNTLAVLEGRLEPIPHVNYETFLEELQTQYATGLSVPRVYSIPIGV